MIYHSYRRPFLVTHPQYQSSVEIFAEDEKEAVRIVDAMLITPLAAGSVTVISPLTIGNRF